MRGYFCPEGGTCNLSAPSKQKADIDPARKTHFLWGEKWCIVVDALLLHFSRDFFLHVTTIFSLKGQTVVYTFSGCKSFKPFFPSMLSLVYSVWFGVDDQSWGFLWSWLLERWETGSETAVVMVLWPKIAVCQCRKFRKIVSQCDCCVRTTDWLTVFFLSTQTLRLQELHSCLASLFFS